LFPTIGTKQNNEKRWSFHSPVLPAKLVSADDYGIASLACFALFNVRIGRHGK
jgi:hypothetical protein